MLIDVRANPNCPEDVLMNYSDVSAPRPVARVRLYRNTEAGEWYDVTGWQADGSPCPAWVRKVEDSGQGVAWGVSGGDGGLRFRPAGSRQPWSLEGPDQFGDAYLVLMEEGDIGQAEE